MMSAMENLDNEDRSWWLSSLIWWSTLATIRFKFWNSQSKYKNQHNQISAKNSQSCLPSCILVELVFKHQEYTSWTIKPPNVLIIFYSWYSVTSILFSWLDLFSLWRKLFYTTSYMWDPTPPAPWSPLSS